MFKFLISLLTSLLFCGSILLLSIWQSHEIIKSNLRQSLLGQNITADAVVMSQALNSLRVLAFQSKIDENIFKIWEHSSRLNSIDGLTNALDQISPPFWNASRKEDFNSKIEDESVRTLQEEKVAALNQARMLFANFLGTRNTPGEELLYTEGIFAGLPTLASFSPPPKTLVELANTISEQRLDNAPIRGYKKDDVLDQLEQLRKLTEEALEPFKNRTKADLSKSATLPSEAKVAKEELRSYLIDIVNKIDVNFF